MKRNENGLTLIEVLAAMTILSIVLLAFFQISSYVSQNAQADNSESDALQKAQAVLNEVRTDPVQYTRDNIAWVDKTIIDGPFTIYVRKNDVPENNTNIVVNATGIPQKQKVSLQTVILFSDNAPRLITVTAAWGG